MGIFKIIGISFAFVGFVAVMFMLLALVGALFYGLETGNTELSNPKPEPTHSDSYYRLVEPTPKATPHPIITPVPTPKRPYHAEGDPRECGTCHAYPTPTSTPKHIPDSYIKPSSTIPIPNDYYSQDCKLPEDQSMQEYLSNSHWVDDYNAGSWDCSQMAAYMEFMLENCGYHVVIREADCESRDGGHAWLLVEFKEGWLAYECTGRYWVYPSESIARSYDPYGYVHWNPSMYDAGVQYESIYDIWDNYKQYSNGEEVFLQEYGWWVE